MYRLQCENGLKCVVLVHIWAHFCSELVIIVDHAGLTEISASHRLGLSTGYYLVTQVLTNI